MLSPYERALRAFLGLPVIDENRLPPGPKTLFVDIECYRNFFYIGVKRREDGRRVGFEFSERSNFDRAVVRRFLRQNMIVTFNGLSYDMPMIYLALDGATNDQLKDASDRIIKGRIRWWDVQRELGVSIPDIDHIDLFEPNPSVGASLKTLNGRLHGQRLQDLPYPEDTILTHEQMDATIDYCLHSDLDATENLFVALQEPIELRAGLGKLYGRDFRSKSDAQMGEGIIKQQVEKTLGQKVKKASISAGSSFQYDVPEWMRFDTPLLQDILKTIAATKLSIDYDGKVKFPIEFEKFKIDIGTTSYKLGIGGLHSQESCRAEVSDDNYVLIDADVASQYPSIIMKLGLYPKALGPEFLDVYRSLIKRRLAAKISGDKTTNLGLKISLNGAYGKLGSGYSVMYAPHLMIAVTLTGQLSLLMLIERAEAAGISVISGNTDGVIFKCPRSLFNGFVQKDGKDTDRLMPSPIQDIIVWWEAVTSFALEFAEYRAIYSRDVNCYCAVKANGKAKRKGPIANHWSPDSPDHDARAQMMKNPQMTVCGDAALAHILHGTPVEKFIREYADVRGFVTVVNATGGATWRDEYLGKVVRYCWSTDGDPIIKLKPHDKTGNRPKVSKTDGCRPLMNLPDAVPLDIDYARYVQEANEILVDIGYMAAPVRDDRPTLFEMALQSWLKPKRRRKVAA